MSDDFELPPALVEKLGGIKTKDAAIEYLREHGLEISVYPTRRRSLSYQIRESATGRRIEGGDSDERRNSAVYLNVIDKALGYIK